MFPITNHQGIEIRTTMRYPRHSHEDAYYKTKQNETKQKITRAGGDIENLAALCTVGGVVKCATAMEKCTGVP